MDMKLQLTNIINGTRKRISSINDLIDWLKISGINFRIRKSLKEHVIFLQSFINI